MIVLLVFSIGPDVLPVLSCAANDSVPSVVKSFATVTENDPELFVIVTEPPADTALAGDEKSELFIVPDMAVNVQYNVPDPKLVVVILNVTEVPSLTDVGVPDIS